MLYGFTVGLHRELVSSIPALAVETTTEQQGKKDTISSTPTYPLILSPVTLRGEQACLSGRSDVVYREQPTCRRVTSVSLVRPLRDKLSRQVIPFSGSSSSGPRWMQSALFDRNGQEEKDGGRRFTTLSNPTLSSINWRTLHRFGLPDSCHPFRCIGTS